MDLTGKLFVFLERPTEATWEISKTTLSHDNWEIEHPYVYDVPGMGFQVKKVVTRGWPACIYCSAKDESRSPLWPEIQSRFLITSPNSVPEKYRAGNMLIAQKMSLPKSIQREIIRSKIEVEIAEKCVMYLSQQIKKFASQDPDADIEPVFIPYGGILGAILRGDKGTDNRINKRVFSFLRMIALSRAHLRYKLHYGDEQLVIADLKEDLHEVLHITQGLTGVPPDKLKGYKNVFLEVYKSKKEPDISKDGTKVEDIIAITTRECCKKHKELTGIDISTKIYKPRYIDAWLEASLIEEQKSNIDNKQYIYFPLTHVSNDDILTQTQEQIENKIDPTTFMISMISRSGRLDNILQHSRIIAPKNLQKLPEKWLELLIWGLLQYPDAKRCFDIADKMDNKVCIYEFIHDYLGENTDTPLRFLSGYCLNIGFHNNCEEYALQLKYLIDFDTERCKTISRSCNLDNKDIISPIQRRELDGTKEGYLL